MRNDSRFFTRILTAATAASALSALSCKEESAYLGPSADTLTAVVEGYLQPESDSFEITLSRGGIEAKTVSHGGYFQLADIPFGLYVLDASAKGYGGYRQLLAVGQRHVLVTIRRMYPYPWPVAQISPSDTLILKSDFSTPALSIRFSRSMDRATVERAISIDPSVPYRLEWDTRSGFDDLSEVIFVDLDPADVAPGRTYLLKLDTTAKTLDGAPLERPIRIPVVNRAQSDGPGGLVAWPTTGVILEAAEPVRLGFSKPMDRSSVLERFRTLPSVGFRSTWDPVKNEAVLTPATHWPLNGELEVILDSGYRTSSGSVGGALSRAFLIGGFAVEYPRSGGSISITEELAMSFTLPIDTSTLRFTTTGSVHARALMTGPNSLLWSFPDAVPGTPFSLRIDGLASTFGDSLDSGAVFYLRPESAPETFQFRNSAHVSAGLQPGRDSLILECGWSAYTRLRNTRFRSSPAYPFGILWESDGNRSAVLHVSFPQPLPAGTSFRIFPDTGSRPGDTVAFGTQPLRAIGLRPFYGEQTVAVDEPILLGWNTFIDTSGFSGRVSFDPPVAILGITQDTLGGLPRISIRHADYAKATGYTVKVSGLTDLFGKPQKDTLEIRFRTAQ